MKGLTGSFALSLLLLLPACNASAPTASSVENATLSNSTDGGCPSCVFGPKRFGFEGGERTRTSFVIERAPAGRCVLRVEDDGEPATTARVWMNGKIVIDFAALLGTVRVAEVPVVVLRGRNGVDVAVRGGAGHSVNLRIACAASPGAPTIVISSGDGQAARPGAAVPIAPSVLVTRADGSPWTGVVVTFAVTGGGGTVTGPTQTTGANGVATVGGWTLGAALGPNTLTATAAVTGLSGNPVSIAALGMDIQTVSGGAGNHTCGVASNGKTYCWGENNWGQLGDGSAIDRYQPTAILNDPGLASLASTFFATCGLTPKGQAYCWGSGSWLSYPWSPTPVGGGLRFVTLNPGTFSVCGLATDGVGYCWGANYNGQLGDGTTTARSTPTPVAGGLQLMNLVVGDKHGCGVTNTGEAWCWGSNQYGMLGDGTTTDHLLPAPVATTQRFTMLSLGNWHTCGLNAAGEAYCWGVNGLGNGTGATELQPAKVVGGHTFTTLTSGAAFTCGLTPSGAVYCWGMATKGELGIGPTMAISIDTPVPVTGGLLFQQIAVGWEHSCGLTAGGTAYCWGDNDNGQVGDGTTVTRWVPTPVMGGLQFRVAGP